jgi:hypothetical protein
MQYAKDAFTDAESTFQRNTLRTLFGISWRHRIPVKVGINIYARDDTQNNDDVCYRTRTPRC